MIFPAIARIRAAVAALRGRLPVLPAVPARPELPTLPDISATLARVEQMRAAAAAHKQQLDDLAANLRDASRRRVD